MDDSNDSDHSEMDDEGDLLFGEHSKTGYLDDHDPDSDVVKKFTPVSILEESDQIIDFPFLDRPIKLEASDSYQDVEGIASCSFMEDPMTQSSDPLTDLPSPQVSEEENQIVVHMDIRSPLSKLRTLVEDKVEQSLTDFIITLQDSKPLDESKSLVDQCMQAKGIVQINCELKLTQNIAKTINIVDVLRPDEDYFVEHPPSSTDEEDEVEEITEKPSATADKSEKPGAPDTFIPVRPAIRPFSAGFPKVRWIVDNTFKAYQEKMGMPRDPEKWSKEQVRAWLMWAVRQFSLSGIELSQWSLTGAELSKLSMTEFKARVPHDPQNSFWTHFELLRKCKVVAVNPDSDNMVVINRHTVEELRRRKRKRGRLLPISNPTDIDQQPMITEEEAMAIEARPSGPLQLWQFLLELLTTWHYRDAIQWIGSEGEFKLNNPELVAHLWGLRKNKPTMNYEKLSRALRYYYDGEMISKVQGKRYVYKFVCDLKTLIGYNAAELNRLVCETEEKYRKKEMEGTLSRPIYVNDFITVVP